jgi:pantetheine-phosphate adenylyltransferase
MPRYGLVATGGTFDVIHKGHVALLRKAFEAGESVVIGVTSDSFARSLGKTVTKDYNARVAALKELLDKDFRGRYSISELNEDFGPALYTGAVQALVASAETAPKGELLNRLRKECGLKPLDIVVVDLVLADDGKPVSSTRIRSGEIDPEGNPTRT